MNLPTPDVRRVPEVPGELTLVTVGLLAVTVFAFVQGTGSEQDALVLAGVVGLGLLAVGTVWPCVALAGARVEVDPPADARAGDSIPVPVRVRTRARRVQLRTLDPPGPWFEAGGDARGVLEHPPVGRGCYHALRVELRSAEPLGVFARRRVIAVALDRPVHVAPRPVDEPLAVHLGTEDSTPPSAIAPTGLAGDAVRSVRPYVAGDSARLVHWPSSARVGSLVVRELEPPARPGLAVVLDLRVPAGASGPGAREPEATAAAEHAASRVAGLVRRALGLGVPVVLATYEEAGPRAAPVSGVRDANRRLARAVPGPPPPPPDGWSAIRVVPT